MTNTTFETRCVNDPQGVIKDLVGQTGRQAKSLSEANAEVERLKELLKTAGIDPTAPKVKKVAGRKKKIETPTNSDNADDCPFDSPD